MLGIEFSPNTVTGCENISRWSHRAGIGVLAVGATLLGIDAALEFIPQSGDIAIAVSSLLTSAESFSLAAAADRWRTQIIEETGQQGSSVVN